MSAPSVRVYRNGAGSWSIRSSTGYRTVVRAGELETTVEEALERAKAKTSVVPDAAAALPFPKPNRNDSRARKAEKHARKVEATRDVRAVVMARAGGVCECGCGRPFGDGFWEKADLDHCRGRDEESVETCWALRRDCDLARTTNAPSRRAWLVKWRAHCQRHGYHVELARTDLELLAMADLAAAEKGGAR